MNKKRDDIDTADMMRMLEKPDGMERLHGFLCSKDSLRELFTPMLVQYMKRCRLSAEDLTRMLLLSRSYVYQLLQGERRPSRDVVIRLALIFHLSVDETQKLLRAAQRGALYPKVHRDACLIYCLEQKLDLQETCELLQRDQEDPLL